MEIFGPHPRMSIISLCRSAIFAGMFWDACKLHFGGILKQMQMRLKEEVTREINNLQAIIGLSQRVDESEEETSG